MEAGVDLETVGKGLARRGAAWYHSILEHQHQVPLELSHGANPSLGQIPFQAS